MQRVTSVLQFPCEFPIKVVGMANATFEATVLTIIRQHVPDLQQENVRSRLSKDNKYLAITVVIHALNQQQLDSIYQALTACEAVLMAL